MSMLERPGGTCAIEAHGLSKRFGQRVGIEDLSMRVQFGDIQGLAGANGGGKSTSLRLFAGLLAADAGTANVLGCDLPGQMHRLRPAVGYLPQRNWLYAQLSVHENLRFRAAVFGIRRAGRAATLQIEAFGLGAWASTPVARLSGGWSRQVELAAVLIHQPRLLLLDEPTVGLDAAARQAIWRRLISLAARGTAIVLSTHDLAEAQRCSHLLLLSDGRVKARGAPQEIPTQLDAAALFVEGQEALAIAEALPERLVMAAYPHGSRIRLVIPQKLLPQVEQRLAAGGCSSERTNLTLEDAALAVAYRGGDTQ